MTDINTMLSSLPESATVALADRVRRLKAEGKNVIALQTGDPDFATPEPIIDAALRALRDGMTHYASSFGLPELREAVAQKLRNVNQLEYDPGDEILISSGGVHAYCCALLAILNPGDEVLIPDPIWMTYENAAKMLGAHVRRVSSCQEDGFWPRIDVWERAISPRTVALVINSPSNPTGSMASKQYLAALVKFAVRHDLYIISDEVYEAIVFDDRKQVTLASLPGARERTLLVNSFSKTYAMTGWRIGYLAGPRHVLGQALKVLQNSITCVPPFVQRGALCALTNPDVASEVERFIETYRRRRDCAVALVREKARGMIGVSFPKGGLYLFLDVRSLGLPSQTIAERLLEEEHVCMVPGHVFGQCGEGFLRATIAADDRDVEAGLQGIIRLATRLRNEKEQG